jgi:hypothetical protein
MFDASDWSPSFNRAAIQPLLMISPRNCVIFRTFTWCPSRVEFISGLRRFAFADRPCWIAPLHAARTAQRACRYHFLEGGS